MSCPTLAGDSNVARAGTSAMRRRQRRLRATLRHERQTVAMELAAALHHSRDVGPGTYDGPSGTGDSEFREALWCPDGARGAGGGSHGRSRGCPEASLLHTVAGGHCG